LWLYPETDLAVRRFFVVDIAPVVDVAFDFFDVLPILYAQKEATTKGRMEGRSIQSLRLPAAVEPPIP
jgi:hypothetical protein